MGRGVRRVALALLAAAFAVTFLPGPWSDERVTDLFLYASYADRFLGGELPYRDVPFEYPPLAAPVIALPGLAGTGEETYRLAFGALALVLAAALVVLAGSLARRTGGDPRRAMLATAAAPLLLGALVRTRFDLAPVVLTVAALALLCAHRPRAGMAVLGLGAMAKGFPLVVAPVALAWLVARGERVAATEGANALALVCATVAAAAVALSPAGALDAVTYHLERPVQIESAPAMVLLGLDALGAGEADVVHSHSSQGVEHPAATAVTGLFGVAMLGAIAVMAAGAARRTRKRSGTENPADARTLALASLGAVAAFAAFGKVLSPQFLIWLLPLGALALAWRMHALALAVAVASVLTMVEFPAHYGDVVARDATALWLVAIRDAIMAGAVALAARELLVSPGPARGSARSRLPARRRRPRPEQH